jgi:hypothetical protein
MKCMALIVQWISGLPGVGGNDWEMVLLLAVL